MSKRILTGFALTFVLFASPPAMKAQRDLEQFADSVDVIEVEVLVQVLHKGEPVRGLTADRVRILDERKPREIVYFEERTFESTASPATGRSESVDPQEPLAQIDSSAQRNFLFVFDATTQAPRRIDQWVTSLGSTLIEAPGTRCGVIIKGTSGFVIASPLTARTEVTSAALTFVEALFQRDVAAMRRAQGDLQLLLQQDDRALALLESRFGILNPDASLIGILGNRPNADAGVASARDISVGPDESMSDRFAVTNRLMGNVVADQVIDLSRSLAATARLFGQPTGDRHVLLISGGVNSEAMVSSPAMDNANVGSVVRGEAQLMFREFHRLGWRIQGLPLGAGFSPGLFYFAEETGGKVYENFHRPAELLAQVERDTSVSYLISFQVPSNELDDRWHQLKVRIDGLPRRARIVHRPAYFASTSPPRPFDERTAPPFELSFETSSD